MQIEPWQVPVLVMTLVILPPSVVWAVRRLQAGSPNGRPAAPPAEKETEKEVTLGRFRTTVLAVLTVGSLGLFFLAIGAEGASLLTSAATAVSTSVAAAVTVRSFLDVKNLKADVLKLGERQKAGGEGAKDAEVQ